MVIEQNIETAVSKIYFREEILYIKLKKVSIVELSHINEIIDERCEMQQVKKHLYW
jgi:hypothetical protein